MTTMLWLTKVGRFKVEHLPYGYLTERVEDGGRPLGVLHTTEGKTIEGALSVFRAANAPTFTVGRDAKGKVRVLQHAPLGVFAHALENRPGGVETNRRATVQVEIVGFSQKKLWLPDGETTEALAALMGDLSLYARIPLRHAAPARDPKKWLAATGWTGHGDVPENEHWDPGKLDWQRLLARVNGALESTAYVVAPKPKPRKVDVLVNGKLRLRAQSPANPSVLKRVGGWIKTANVTVRKSS